MSDPRLLWWVDRSSGMVSMLLLTLVVCLGVASSGRPGTALRRRTQAQALHRHVSLLAAVLLTVHVTTAVLDSYVPLSPLDVVLPLHAEYRPLWIGFGAAAVDLLLALGLTSLLRSRLADRTWRRVHHLAYAMWPLAMTHALGTGSDVRAAVVRGAAAACLVLVSGVVLWRLTWAAKHRWALVSLLAVVTAGLGAWAATGPLTPEWSTKALGAR